MGEMCGDILREFMRLAEILCIAKRVAENGVNSNAHERNYFSVLVFGGK